jgi:NAD(P)H dehydrogenase (quinone)
MRGNIAVIYAGELAGVADTFGEAAAHMAARVRVLRVGGGEGDERAGGGSRAGLGDLEWADGIAFGTPIGDGAPAALLMRFIASTEPLWSSGRLYDKAVTVFTDEPEHFAPDSVLHPIYDALYQWGAVIIGPRAFELARDAHPTDAVPSPSSALPAARLRTARYRAARLARLAGVLADERHRRERLEL